MMLITSSQIHIALAQKLKTLKKSRSAANSLKEVKDIMKFEVLRSGPVTCLTIPRPTTCDSVLAAGSRSGMISTFDICTGQVTFQFNDHTSYISQIASIRSKELLSSSFDRPFRLWDLRTKKCHAVVESGCGPLTTVSVCPYNDSLVVCCGADSIVRFWDIRYDITRPCAVLKGHKDRVSQLNWDGEGRLVSASYDGSVRLWDGIGEESMQILTQNKHNSTSPAITQLFSSSFLSFGDTNHHNQSGEFTSNIPEKRCWIAAGGRNGNLTLWSGKGDDGSTDRVISI